MDKTTVRKEVKIRRTELSFQEKQEKDDKIFENIITHPSIIDQEMVYAYFSLNEQGEVDTHNFIEYALEKGIGIALPKIVNGRIEFYKVTSLNDLETGKLGIKEPSVNCKRVYNDTAVILLPGLAFDYSGNRLGYGKGYYDEYLVNTKHRKIALAYNFQIYDKLEVLKHDIAVDEIITESKTIHCHNQEVK